MPSDLELRSAIIAARDAGWRDLFRTTVVECGLDPLVSRSGREAVDQALSTTARLVILGLLMPSCSALRTCAHIRDLPAYAATPIIIIAAAADPGLEDAAMQAGASLLLTMPLSIFALRQGILPLLGAKLELPPSSTEWQRKEEPSPLFGEPEPLARGRELLKIDRQSYRGSSLRRLNWRR